MTKEEKELLIKDLCARLPYGVMCHADEINLDGELLFINKSYNIVALYNDKAVGKFSTRPITDVKLYLRPISSMTDDELIEIYKISGGIIEKDGWDFGSKSRGFGDGYEYIGIDDMSDILDWLNSHHFDYRGLIKKGLALEAKEGMYKTE